MRSRLSMLMVATLVVCLADERRDAAEKAFKEAEKLMWQRTADSLTRALEQFGKVLAAWEEIGDRKQQGMTLSRLGLTQFFQGNFRPALDQYERALPLLTQAEDQEWTGITLGNIAQ